MCTEMTFFCRQSQVTDDLQQRFVERKWKWPLYGTLLLIVVNLVRSWPTLKHPGFYVEDSLLFSAFYGPSRSLTDIFYSHIGQPYLTVLSNLVSWASSYADVRLQPYLYQWIGFLCGTGAAVCFFFPA